MKNSIAILFLISTAAIASADTFCRHPENPHYFLFGGKPTILITSAEHYGAVINLDFDYVKFLDTLAADHLNHARLFVGPYREKPGAFGIQGNTLAPKPDRYICAWQRSDTPGSYDNLNKFDLSKWNDAFFERLKDYCREAGKRGIVIEINLFCPYYCWDKMWDLSPLNIRNNINGVGDVNCTDVYKMSNTDIVEQHVRFTRKVIAELNGFDNIYYEICNEPWVHDVEMAWQEHIVDTIVDAEKSSPNKHLISLNVSNGWLTLVAPHKAVSIFNFHYANPPTAVSANYHLNKPIGFNETGFSGQANSTYRTQAWQFIFAGGALFNNLDYSFAVGHEDGSFKYDTKTPGGGNAEFRRQLRHLARFINDFDFIHARPDNSVIRGVHTLAGSAYCLAVPDKSYAIYASGTGEMFLYLDLPPGDYSVTWVDPKTGELKQSAKITHDRGLIKLVAPDFKEDIALRLDRLSNGASRP